LVIADDDFAAQTLGLAMTQMLSDEDRAELTRLEEDMWRPGTRFDRSFQESRFAQDFVEFGRSGRVYSRQEAVVTDSRPINAQFPLQDLRIRLLGGAVAQVMYTSRVVREGIVEYARRSSIWSKTDAGWIMRFHQGTPFAPDGS
jgi:hypothetical protein